jgi:eukaryotic-like serine/threonine-protein kinase
MTSHSSDSLAREPSASAEADSEWVARLVDDMASAWKRGECPTASSLLSSHPEIDEQGAIRLIYEEVCLRRETGQNVTTSEVVRQFPRWGSELAVLLSCDRLMRPPAPVTFPEVGNRLGDFQLLVELGRGNAGRTYLAAHLSLAERPVVLKITARAHDEHLSLARLQHTHIVPLYSEHVFPDRGLRALCMPHLGGANLAQILESLSETPPAERTGRDVLQALDRHRIRATNRTPMDGPFRSHIEQASYVSVVCGIATCLADALQYAHDRGIVHMDVKPANVLLAGDGQPMLLDFHLACEPVTAGRPTPDRLGGTTGWMSPEQRQGMQALRERRDVPKRIDGRSDIYSLGLVLHEALGGRTGAAESPVRHRLDRLNPHVSMGLADIVSKCLAEAPRDRYRSAAELADDLRRHLNHLPLAGVSNRSVRERWDKWRRRKPHALGRETARVVAASAVFAGVLLFGVFHQQRLREIEGSLADARRLHAAHQYSEAIRSARRGLTLSKHQFASAQLASNLKHQLYLSQRGQKARDLRDLADIVRFRFSVAPGLADESRAMARRCRAIWDERAFFQVNAGGRLDSETEEGIRTDLRELAVVWTELHTRLAAPVDKDEAHREALNVLTEAEVELGPTLSLSRERRRHAQALQRDTAKYETDPEPRSSWDHYDLGRSYLRSERFAEAANEFRRTLEQRPGDFWPNFYQGLCVYRLGDFEEALAAFRACIALAPDKAECYFNRALVLNSLGRADDASRDYTKALELDAGLAEAALNRGILAHEACKYDRAIADFQRALLNSSSRGVLGRVHYNLALAQLGSFDRASALASLERAVESGSPEARSLLVRLREETPSSGEWGDGRAAVREGRP